MAAINDLLRQVPDQALRARLEEEIERISKNKKFGLVFEEHIPECTPLYGIGIKPGISVARKTSQINEVFTVVSMDGDNARCYSKVTRETEVINISDLVPVAQFGEPIFPMLQPIDAIQNAPDSSLWHTLIEADNYHALQLLEYLYARKVDCIYIDPPYNAGAKDWKYNNDYVDGSDSYRHSKWLSMMEKRLKIAKKLLNPKDSVMIVTIDEKEYLHLGCLIEEMFPEADIEMVTSVINARGRQRTGKFARTEEYLFFVKIGNAFVHQEDDPDYQEGADVPWRTMRRSSLAGARGRHGAGACGPNQFYPVYVSDEGKIVDIGKSLPEDQSITEFPAQNGVTPVFPIRDDGTEMNWGITDGLAVQLWKKGYIRVGRHTPRKPQKWELSYYTSGKIKDIESGRAVIVGSNPDGSVQAKYVESKQKYPSSVWVKSSHNAETEGTNLIKAIFNNENRFTYPKSLYAVRDSIALFIGDKPDALVVDFFAGSGTTLHAVNLLNAEDKGHRRCIMVTNNEVSNDEAKSLSTQGFLPGDPEWERYGIARYVTWPRVKCSITGCDIEGNPLSGFYGVEIDQFVPDSEGRGKYIKKKIPVYPTMVEMKLEDGFAANVEYFKLGFLNKDSVTLGRQFKEILPLLWLKTGAVGKRPDCDEQEPEMMILPENEFAILVDEMCYARFIRDLAGHDEIKTVFFVTDSEDAFREMSAGVGDRKTHHLYREYIENFVIGSRRV